MNGSALENTFSAHEKKFSKRSQKWSEKRYGTKKERRLGSCLNTKNEGEARRGERREHPHPAFVLLTLSNNLQTDKHKQETLMTWTSQTCSVRESTFGRKYWCVLLPGSVGVATKAVAMVTFDAQEAAAHPSFKSSSILRSCGSVIILVFVPDFWFELSGPIGLFHTSRFLRVTMCWYRVLGRSISTSTWDHENSWILLCINFNRVCWGLIPLNCCIHSKSSLETALQSMYSSDVEYWLMFLGQVISIMKKFKMVLLFPGFGSRLCGRFWYDALWPWGGLKAPVVKKRLTYRGVYWISRGRSLGRPSVGISRDFDVSSPYKSHDSWLCELDIFPHHRFNYPFFLLYLTFPYFSFYLSFQ